MEQFLYEDKVIFSRQTPYQKMVITEWKGGKEVVNDFFSNGGLQFCSRDEHRYHEPLVHLPMLLAKERKKILILGGGDGLAAREALKYPEVQKVVLVDIDKKVTDFFTKNFVGLNNYSLSDPRVQIVNMDADIWLDKNLEKFDVIIVHFPDPKNIDINKLYTWGFYKKVKRHLSFNGFVSVQSTSPVHANKAFLCIGKTLREAGFIVMPYQNDVPSFGKWGWYLLWQNSRWSVDFIQEKLNSISDDDIPVQTKFLNADVIKSVQLFGKSELGDFVEVNYRSRPHLVRYYEQAWQEDY